MFSQGFEVLSRFAVSNLPERSAEGAAGGCPAPSRAALAKPIAAAKITQTTPPAGRNRFIMFVPLSGGNLAAGLCLSATVLPAPGSTRRETFAFPVRSRRGRRKKQIPRAAQIP